MEGDSRLKKVVGAAAIFATGAAIGTGITLLTAPASGRVTRQRIGRNVKKLKRAAGKRLTKAQRALARNAGKVQRSAVKTFSHARQWVNGQVGNGFHRQSERRRLPRPSHN